MAPSLQMLPDDTKAQLNDLKKNKIRKPVIEKMRRDRINHSIEQLRILLERNFQTHHPHSKLEKADILEMAVSYLQQQKKHQMNRSHLLPENVQDSYYQGYYMCLKETVGFLHTQENGHIQEENKNLTWNDSCLPAPYQSLYQQRVSLQVSPGSMKIWRPWQVLSPP
ncbi:hypothetical protein XENTR_v10019055 [Xenopus tropicalis]|uniref:Transcription factor HES-5 n=1 Tax=Xenopus tropicalis TaxID=8364 RepID=Q28F58_XENTR|nr:hairy and enhancer of split 5 gene 10 [Xenopus tropicalis]XP_012822165.1 hairy and enhancer of split 5 gene 10 isoform X1 [Xenopus tropicalis]AAI57346.1 hairy and enhancer of split 3, gene 1 [Xenopus tropicalis]KAE8593264.1 hypothetical protein XENTR_v10019055 [Xenopus tropicalis]CAJ83992.1 similar to hes5 (hairy and enhancer of split 5 (Drosophila)) [Xenopus tropicalis]|eukprot:XP_012822165.1 PREDICTED: hairy and enhancer of split 3, gene 1 isoform X1 [Xenopus tropicalis]